MNEFFGLVRIVLTITLLAILSPAVAQEYDLVILNGRVMDPETGFDEVRNVGVKNGKIAVITSDEIVGADTIDASNYVVSPGFVDGHVHTVDMPLGQKAALRDGVTTTLDLEVGVHPVDRWYAHLNGRSQTNYGASASAVGARVAVFNPGYNSETGGTGLDMFFGRSPVG